MIGVVSFCINTINKQPPEYYLLSQAAEIVTE